MQNRSGLVPLPSSPETEGNAAAGKTRKKKKVNGP